MAFEAICCQVSPTSQMRRWLGHSLRTITDLNSAHEASVSGAIVRSCFSLFTRQCELHHLITSHQAFTERLAEELPTTYSAAVCSLSQVGSATSSTYTDVDRPSVSTLQCEWAGGTPSSFLGAGSACTASPTRISFIPRLNESVCRYRCTHVGQTCTRFWPK